MRQSKVEHREDRSKMEPAVLCRKWVTQPITAGDCRLQHGIATFRLPDPWKMPLWGFLPPGGLAGVPRSRGSVARGFILGNAPANPVPQSPDPPRRTMGENPVAGVAGCGHQALGLAGRNRP